MAQIDIVQGDITEQDVDAVVNAANPSLLGGGGVDGAIHRAGGPEILEQCRRLGGCGVGEAKATTGGRLPARFVIHTVGPIWRGGDHGEREQMRAAHESALRLAQEIRAQSIAFPAISCGIYGFPVDEAAPIAIAAARDHAGELELVRFVLFDGAAYDAFARAAAG